MSEHNMVGLVVAGAAARGAYEAGALSVLIPELAGQGKRPTVMVGSSAGGINALLLAQYSDLEAQEAVAKVVAVWSQLELANVISLSWPTALGTGVRYLAESFGIPGVRLKSLFDTAPLRATVERYFDPDRLHRNIQEGLVRALALAATTANRRTTVFVEAAAGVPLPPTDEARAIDYVAARIETAHVLASAAIPVLFPPIFVERPHEAPGWYRDGLVRLNAPIKPALALGAVRLALVASDPDTYSSPAPPDQDVKTEPDMGDAGSQLLQAVLADRMIEDIHTLRKVNRLVGDNPSQRIRKDSGGLYQFIEHIFAGPSEPGLLGKAAEDFLEKDNRWGLMSASKPAFMLLGMLVGRNSMSRGELLSWLLFEPDFMKELIERGKIDAYRRLAEAQQSGAFPFD